jgi:hypothetical protein
VPKITAPARQARRQDLIEATWRLLARSGWRDLTVDDICAEDGIEAGELRAVPANAMASILLALTEGLVLHGSLDRRVFRWTNVYRALDFLLDGIKP